MSGISCVTETAVHVQLSCRLRPDCPSQSPSELHPVSTSQSLSSFASLEILLDSCGILTGIPPAAGPNIWTHTYTHMATYIRFLFSGRFVIMSQFPKQIHKIIFLLPPMYLIILENCPTFILYTFSQIHKRTVCVDMIYSMTCKL